VQVKKNYFRDITRKHLKIARILLDLDQKQVCKELKISLPTLTNLERSDVYLENSRLSTIKKITEFYEKNGIVFIFSYKDGGDGVKKLN
jgi:transcriptional regulator with XRE-family HTH domain